MTLNIFQVRTTQVGGALRLILCLAFAVNVAHSALIGRGGHDWKLQGRQLLQKSSRPLGEAKICGPTALSGRVHFRDWKSILPGASLKRTGIACQHVPFGLIPFASSNDLSIFLTADRVDASLELYSPPVVWTRALTNTGFEACVYIPAVPGQLVSMTKDRVAISWMAVKGQKKLTSAFKVNFATEIDRSIDGSAVCSRTIPGKLDPDADVILTSVTHQKPASVKWFGSRSDLSLPSEAFGTWIQPTEKSNVDRHEVCVQRLIENGGKDEEKGMQVNMIGFSRDKKFSGLLKLRLPEGRVCKVIAITKPMYRKGIRTGQIQLSVRLHENDAVHAESRRPLVSAWISERSDDGFTICAEQVVHSSRENRMHLPHNEKASSQLILARTMSEDLHPPKLIAGKENDGKLRNSVQISWIALPKIDSTMVRQSCIHQRRKKDKKKPEKDETKPEKDETKPEKDEKKPVKDEKKPDLLV